MDMGNQSSPSSSSSASSSPEHGVAAAQARKRPAGRTKFRETRHPVFRGVRRRGRAGRWVCEVRVPGNRGARLWLGTYLTAEAAARAHDAAMLALSRAGGGGGACLNFPDSAWLLAVPPPSALPDLTGVRRAATEAVAAFLRRMEAADEVTSGASPPSLPDNAIASPPASATASGYPSTVTLGMAAAAAATLDDGVFELDLFGDIGLDTYYANLAQGLLMEPPPPPAAAGSYWDNDDAGADHVALWSY